MSELTQKQAFVVRFYIRDLIRRRCVCHVHTNGKKCSRCNALTDARDAFPDIFTIAAEDAALAGPKEDF